jgi:hypothetical protein
MADDILTFIGRLLIEQDAGLTPTFLLDRDELGGRVAAMRRVEDDWGAQEQLAFLTDPTEG